MDPMDSTSESSDKAEERAIKIEELLQEPYYFLAKHSKGAQSVWLNSFQNECFLPRVLLPSTGEMEKIAIIVEPLDMDFSQEFWEHTRFQFSPVYTMGDLAECLKRLKHNRFTDSLQIAIYEEKLNMESFDDVTFSDFPEFLHTVLFKRLAETINFVHEMHKCLDLTEVYDEKAEYDPMRVVMSLTVETDDTGVPEWMAKLMEWQGNKPPARDTSLLPKEQRGPAQSLIAVFQLLAEESGYTEWVIGEKAQVRSKYPDDIIFHLRAYFSLQRMCVGVEILSDVDFHPYLENTLFQRTPSLAAYVAKMADVMSGNLVLDLTVNVQDYMMAMFHSYDFINYLNVVNNEDHANYAVWNGEQMMRHCEQTIGDNSHNHDVIFIRDWTEMEHQEILLSQVDRLILTVDLMERPYSEDLEEQMIFMKSDYDAFVRIAKKMREYAIIVLIIPLGDWNYVQMFIKKEKLGLKIKHSRILFDGDENFAVVQLKRVPTPVLPPSSEENFQRLKATTQELKKKAKEPHDPPAAELLAAIRNKDGPIFPETKTTPVKKYIIPPAQAMLAAIRSPVKIGAVEPAASEESQMSALTVQNQYPEHSPMETESPIASPSDSSPEVPRKQTLRLPPQPQPLSTSPRTRAAAQREAVALSAAKPPQRVTFTTVEPRPPIAELPEKIVVPQLIQPQAVIESNPAVQQGYTPPRRFHLQVAPPQRTTASSAMHGRAAAMTASLLSPRGRQPQPRATVVTTAKSKVTTTAAEEDQPSTSADYPMRPPRGRPPRNRQTESLLSTRGRKSDEEQQGRPAGAQRRSSNRIAEQNKK